MKIGAVYRVRPVFAKAKDGVDRQMKGKCVAVHPKGRFAVLEFDGVWGKVRECFWPEEVTEHNRAGKKG